MDQPYKVAANELEKIQKKRAKEIPEVKADLTALISDLKKGAKIKREVKTKFDTLEQVLKTKKPDVWKHLEAIRNTLDIDSMGIFGASNSPIQLEERARADSEMAFMVECFRAILEILQDNGSTSIFPEPAKRLTEKVSEGYGYASKVASLCKEQKSELDRMSKIIEDLYDQAVEGNDDLKQGKPEKITTTGSNKGSIEKGKSVPKKPDPSVASTIEIKGKAVSSALKKTKGDLKFASTIIEDLYTQVVEVNEDQVQKKIEKPTAPSSKKGSQDKGQTVPKKPEPDMASDLQTKGSAVISALTKMKGGLEHASKIIEDLYSQAVEGTDDKAQRKQETLTPTSSKKGSTVKGQTVQKKPEPDIPSTIEMKGKAVSSALKNMKGDLEHMSKIFEDLYSQAVEVKNDQVQGKPEKPVTTRYKQGSRDKGQTVPKKPEPTMAPTLIMKVEAVSSALKKTKGDLDFASQGMSQLVSLIQVDEVEKTQNVHTNRSQGQQHTATEGQKRSGLAPEAPPVTGSSQLNEDFQNVLSALREMKKTLAEMKEKEQDLVFASRGMSQLVSLIKVDEAEKTQHLHANRLQSQQHTATGRQKRSGPAPEAPPVTGSSQLNEDFQIVLSALKEMKEKIMEMEEKERKAQYASKLLDQLYQKATAVNGNQVNDQIDKPKKNEVSKKTKGNEDSQDQTKSETYKVSKHDQIFESVSLTLMKMETANSDVKRLTYEIESLEDMMAELETCISEGGEKPVSLYASNEMNQESQAYKSARQIFQMFKEKESQVKKLKDEYDFLVGLLGALHETVTGGEDRLSKKETSATTENDRLEYDRANKILRIFQEKEMETELTSKLLEELHQLSSVKDVEYLREKGQSPRGENKESQQRTPESNKRTSGSHLSLNPQDNFEVVKSALHQLKVVQGEIEYASSKLEKLGLVSDNVGIGDETVGPLTNTTSKVSNSSFKTRDGGATESGQGKISLDENIARVGELIKKQSREIYILKQKIIEAESDLHNSKISQEKILQDVKSLQTRLSEFASAKLMHNNPNIADLSDPNRPTKLQEQYSELYDNVWTDAFDKLSHASPKRTERDITNVLLEIFMEGFLFCRQRREMQIRGLLGIIFHPESDIPSNQVEDADIKQNEVFEKHLTDSVKFGSNKAGENVAEAFFRKEDMQKKFGHQIQMNETYVKQSVKLCWLMQCQTPPVCIDLAAKPNDLFNKDTYKEYTKKGSKIDFVVWPPLRLHQGGPLLAKGVAQGK